MTSGLLKLEKLNICREDPFMDQLPTFKDKQDICIVSKHLIVAIEEWKCYFPWREHLSKVLPHCGRWDYQHHTPDR